MAGKFQPGFADRSGGIPVRVHVTSLVDSFAAPQVLLTALLGLVSVRDQGMTEGRLRRFEEMAKWQRLFHSED